MSGMCPHCGLSLEKDEGLHFGAWSLWLDKTVHEGREIALTNQERGLLYTLAKAGGGWVRAEALLNRISGSDDPALVSVVVSRLRKKLGTISPIETDRSGPGSRGLRWGAAA